VPRPKLFSSEVKADLAGLKTIYHHNRERANSGNVYVLQAAEAAWNLCDVFIKVSDRAGSIEDLNEIIMRIKDDLDEVVLLSAKPFAERKTELITWIKQRRAKARTVVKRLRTRT
jgi:hypothetical protein